jgi:serine/threonine protein kinase
MSTKKILIRGKYEIISKIGQGKFGSVFKAINTVKKNILDNNYVAVKMETTDCRILKHETTIINYLNKNKCNNIPLVHWYGIFNDIPCLVTPFYHYSLTQFIKDKKYQEQSDKMAHTNLLMQKMLDILKNCHGLFVIHRDIKPDNFMFNHKNELILLDFGLGTFIDTENEEPEIQNSFIGNVIYASPNIHKNIKSRKIDDIISVSYIYLLIYLGGKLPWMNLNGNNELNENKFNEISNLKEIQNILLHKKNDDKIFDFIEKAYNNNNMSYIF